MSDEEKKEFYLQWVRSFHKEILEGELIHLTKRCANGNTTLLSIENQLHPHCNFERMRLLAQVIKEKAQ